MRLQNRFLSGLLTMAVIGIIIDNSQPILADTTVKTLGNGTIVSKQLVSITGQNPSINIYKLFYMSDGEKAEALVSEPKAPGKYPLLVNLHGGWAGPQPTISHYNFGYQANSLSTASNDVVIIEPEYRGYKASGGTVQGLYGDTLDTQNAIKAAMSFSNIKPNSTYLLGYSMGGGVALTVASERKDVRAVVAVSPFVGWDEIIDWMNTHPKVNTPSIVAKYRVLAKQWAALFQNNRMLQQQNSLLNRIPDIHAPVLFLQGTGDQNVVWQTVQQYAEDMKAAHKTVKLVLYPGGNHGLHDQYETASYNEMLNWFYKLGLSDPWL